MLTNKIIQHNCTLGMQGNGLYMRSETCKFKSMSTTLLNLCTYAKAWSREGVVHSCTPVRIRRTVQLNTISCNMCVVIQDNLQQLHGDYFMLL